MRFVLSIVVDVGRCSVRDAVVTAVVLAGSDCLVVWSRRSCCYQFLLLYPFVPRSHAGHFIQENECH